MLLNFLPQVLRAVELLVIIDDLLVRGALAQVLHYASSLALVTALAGVQIPITK